MYTQSAAAKPATSDSAFYKGVQIMLYYRIPAGLDGRAVVSAGAYCGKVKRYLIGGELYTAKECARYGISRAFISPCCNTAAYKRLQRLLFRPWIPAPRRTLYSSAQPPYYNKVYKGAWGALCYGPMPDSAADCRLCKPGGWRSGTGQSGTLHPAGQSSGQGAAGGAEPLATLAAALFGLSPDS